MEDFSNNLANLRAIFSINDLAKQCGYDLHIDSLKIRSGLEANLRRYYTYLESILNTTPKHLQTEQSEFLRREVEIKYGVQSKATLESTLKMIKQYNADFDMTFYKGELLKQMPLESLCKNALNSWDGLLKAKIHMWRQKYIAEQQSTFVAQISEYIELMQQYFKQLKAFGKCGGLFSDFIMQSLREALEDFISFGDLRDLGENHFDDLNDKANNWEENNLESDNKGDLKDLSDFNQNHFNKFVSKNNTNLAKSTTNFTKWLKFLEKDSVKKLCDMLGSLYKTEREIQFERFATQENFNTTIPTPYAKEEISGVTLGRDLENILPQELSLLDDKDFSILFDLKFAENRLFCFEKQGYESEGKIQKAQEKGAMILCIDTSGSMSGIPETIAKAIALFIAQKAMEAKRKCYLINFSIGINTLDLTPPNGFFELIKFLEMSFNGGTDALPALKAGLAKMNEEGYKKANLLMISDFVFDSLDLAEFEDLSENKCDDNKCYALYIGDFTNKTQDSKLFSKEFYFNDNTHEVIEFCKEIV